MPPLQRNSVHDPAPITTMVTPDDRGRPDVDVPKIPEIERLRLQNLLLEQQVSREQLNVLTLQFLQTEPPRELHAKIEHMTRQLNSLAERVFADAQVDPRRYQLNVADGIFVERPDTSERGA